MDMPPGWACDRYRLEGTLRPPSLGFSFWTAWDEETGERVMVKGIRCSRVTNLLQECFREEGSVVSTLRHPNILRLVDRREAGEWYIHVYELEGADTLATTLARGPLGLERTLSVVQQVVDALAELHARGLVHGYAHPDNVLVRPDGHVKVTGFAFGWERFHTLVPGFSAPEHVLRNERTSRGDAYLVGGLLWHALVGEPYVTASSPAASVAFHRDPPPPDIGARVPGLPRWLQRLVWRCLSADPAHRPVDADEIWVELEGRTPSRGLPVVHEAFASVVERPWPEPIPAILADLHLLESPSLALLRLLDLTEVLIKLAAAVGADRSTGAPLLPERPSLGHWMRVLHDSGSQLGSAMPKRTLSLFESMVAVRNDHRGHGSLGTGDVHERVLRQTVEPCAAALAETPLFADLRWEGGLLSVGAVSVRSPLLVNRDRCPVCARTEVFVYNGVRGNSRSYLSYETSHVARRA